MMCSLKRHLCALLVLLVLPTIFWGTVFYIFVDPNLGKGVALVMFIAGGYSCIKGAKAQYKCPKMCSAH